jgi:hypothetical protein
MHGITSQEAVICIKVPNTEGKLQETNSHVDTNFQHMPVHSLFLVGNDKEMNNASIICMLPY